MTPAENGWSRSASGALPPPLRDRLYVLTRRLHDAPETIDELFTAAARLVGRGPLDRTGPHDLLAPSVEDISRVHLLLALAEVLPPQELTEVLRRLYEHGDGDEKRAVIQSMAHLPSAAAAAAPLLHDALRSNDLRLVAAAMGRGGREHLDDAAWRHGVLKCLFTGVSLRAVDGLHQRCDADLWQMVAAFVDERSAAGRDIPEDVWLVLGQPARALRQPRGASASS